VSGPRRGGLHHLELWLDAATDPDGAWPWLLRRLGYELQGTWSTGQTWALGDAYVVLESGPDHVSGPQHRTASGMNHVAFWAGSRDDVGALAREATGHGWSLMFADRHPYAGGPDHYAAYLEDAAGFEVELVADDARHDPPVDGRP
jgi:catechol-2,3-dioxygenase